MQTAEVKPCSVRNMYLDARKCGRLGPEVPISACQKPSADSSRKGVVLEGLREEEESVRCARSLRTVFGRRPAQQKVR